MERRKEEREKGGRPREGGEYHWSEGNLQAGQDE